MTLRKLAAERRRREAAEAEVTQLRAQLETVTTSLATARIPANAVESLTELISQLKQTGQQLEDQQGLVRQVIDNSPNLIFVEDEQGRCVLTNKSYIQLQKQRIDRPGTDTLPLGAGADFRPRQTEWPTDSSTSFEECYHLKDGQTVWYYTTKSPLLRNDGSRYLLTYSSDITDLKRAYRVAEESVQAKQTFMANMSHEIRTPLHGVMGLTELLKKGPLAPEQADYVEMIQSSTENLLVIINDILDFAKIEAGSITLENIPFDILKTVQDAARSLSFKIAEKGLLLHIVNLNEHLPQAQGDPFRLHQVLVNLISNAIKFTPHGVITITIDGHQEGSQLPVTFSVADTGIGISSTNLHQIFDSFRQADSSIPRLYGGTGLGLTICKNLVELQGGKIGVRSEPGQGSCFYFSVPYTVSEGPITQEASVVESPELLQGLSILLAEDNSINQLIAVAMLGQWHVMVDLAQNGEEALIKAAQRKYDIILMDVQMPQLDGLAATSRLRSDKGLNQNTPVIALTADAIRISEDSYKELGFNAFLTKPYSEAELYATIAEVSQRQQLPLPVVAPEVVPSNPEVRYDFYMLGKLASNKEFIRKMLELFIARVPGQVESLQAAVEQENWAEVAREAHTLKSTFGSLNIQPETSNLKRLEELAELQAPKHELQPLSTAVAKATQQFVDLFSQELAQLF